jgi:hypothetical protein
MKYRKAAMRLKKQALESSFFSSIEVWSPKRIKKLAPAQFENLKRLVNSNNPDAVGFGYWYWKPVIIEESLKQLPEGAILVYLDAGCYLNLRNSDAIARFKDYLDLTVNHGSLAMQLNDGEFDIEDLREKSWTSEMVLDQLCVQEEFRETNQIQAGIQLIAVNSESRNFASLWTQTCESNNFELLIGTADNAIDNFESHRYDQSIFSCLYKEAGRFHIPDETYFMPDWKISGRNFPIWAMRNRDGIDPFNIKIEDIFARFLRKIQIYWTRTP